MKLIIPTFLICLFLSAGATAYEKYQKYSRYSPSSSVNAVLGSDSPAALRRMYGEMRKRGFIIFCLDNWQTIRVSPRRREYEAEMRVEDPFEAEYMLMLLTESDGETTDTLRHAANLLSDDMAIVPEEYRGGTELYIDVVLMRAYRQRQDHEKTLDYAKRVLSHGESAYYKEAFRRMKEASKK